MATLLYSPGVKIYVSTANNGTIEVSDDVVDGTMVRRSDGVSSFNFSLQNARRKYDGLFAPNDRIVVMMRRITWMRVFTGYLNSVPLVTAWPRVVPLAASCSLKRLQYWYWDAGLPASQQLVAQALQAVKTAEDGGIANAILTIMKEVVGWPPEKIHIGGIPKDWFDLAYKIAQDVDARAEEADEIAAQFYSALQGGGVIGGGTITTGGAVVANGTMAKGNYGGEAITGAMAPYIEDIYNAGRAAGATDRDIIIAMMTAMQESSMGSDTRAMTEPNQFGCIGLFQQTIKGFRPGWGPNEGWGTEAQLRNPEFQCKNFFNRLLKVEGRENLSLAQAAEKVQASGEGFRYARHEAMGRAVVTYLKNAAAGNKGVTEGNDPNWKAGAGAWGQGKSTGQALADLGVKLVTDYPNIRYNMGGDASPITPPNKIVQLDCSSFVQWCYYNLLGSLKGLPRTTWDQIKYLKVHGKQISAEQGANTAGAVLYPTSGGHVEISLGDGIHVVGAHNTADGVNVKKFGSKAGLTGYLTQAYLLPNLQYAIGSGGTYNPVEGDEEGKNPDPGAADQVPIQTAADQPWYNPADPFDKLFGNNPWTPVVNQAEAAYSSTFTGIRALLNDQPLLPYLKNLFNATMRSFCSAPNGDLIGWFPDYYGIWGTAASMIVEPIEIKDFNVEWSDDFFVTHQYTVASASTNSLDLATGLSSPADVLPAATTVGIATIDIPSILYALFGIEPDKENAQKFINFIYNRFGARPDFQQLPGVVGTKGEFFSALFLFMRQWAYQYNADIPMTFMPEMWPGMLIKIPAFDFQAYVTTVTHCQPAGTLIRVSDIPTREEGSGKWSKTTYRDVPIETLKEGDKAVSWISQSSNFSKSGQVINKITTRLHDGPLVVAAVGDATTRYAPNHHCVVKLGGPLDEGGHVVYLMRRGGQFRAGRCLWSYGNKAIGPIRRTIDEQADAVWVLSVHETLAEAALHEALIQTEFGLPRESFVHQKNHAFSLVDFWGKLGENVTQARECLDRYGLLIDYPLWSADGIRLGRGEVWTQSAGTRNRIVTAAANLRSGMKMLRVGGATGTLRYPDSEELRQEWVPLRVSDEWYTGLIYSLSVERDHTYIADGVMTHNSFSFGEQGGFSTSVNIAAPARLPKSVNDRSHVLIGLPIAGGLAPTPPKNKK